MKINNLQTIIKLLDADGVLRARNKAGPICASCLEDVPDPVCKALMLKGKPFIYLGTCARCHQQAVLALVDLTLASP